MQYSDIDILFLTTKEIPDYLQDAVYMGFRELGCNIVDFPRRTSLHGTWCRPDYRTEQLLFYYSELNLRKKPIDILIVTGMIHNYNTCGTFEGWGQFINKMIEETQPKKLIMLDAEDFPQCSYPIISRNFDVVFKRELFTKPYHNWYNLSFASIPEPFEYVYYPYRKYDVSFIATLSHGFREEVRDFLVKKTQELNLSAFIYLDRQPLPRADYLKILSQSKTSISVRGMGCDCYRFWEIPAKGVTMITDDRGLLIENNFNDDHVFKFKTLKELEQILIKIKNSSSEALEAMALKSLLHTTQYHTPKKRAEYILQKIEETKSI